MPSGILSDEVNRTGKLKVSLKFEVRDKMMCQKQLIFAYYFYLLLHTSSSTFTRFLLHFSLYNNNDYIGSPILKSIKTWLAINANFIGWFPHHNSHIIISTPSLLSSVVYIKPSHFCLFAYYRHKSVLPATFLILLPT